jgi:integrase
MAENRHLRHVVTGRARCRRLAKHPKCGKEGWYGFHDIRRGFATANAENLDLFELQGLMQHKSLATTKLYVNMAEKLNRTTDKLAVPAVLRKNG